MSLNDKLTANKVKGMIPEAEKAKSCLSPLATMLKGGALPVIQPNPYDCAGYKQRVLHHYNSLKGTIIAASKMQFFEKKKRHPFKPITVT